MSRNFHYMLDTIGMAATTLATEEGTKEGHILSKNNILNFLRPDSLTSTSEYSIRGMVEIYNNRMANQITIEDFKNKDLSQLGVKEPLNERPTWDLIGDYIALYLDENGDGDILGMFIRIEEGNEPYFVVHAIHKIRGMDTIMAIDANDLFSGDIDVKHEEFMIQYQHRRKNSKYFLGSVSNVGSCARINLASNQSVTQFQILLEMEGYLKEKDTAKNMRPDGYRGGLGLAIVTNSNGTYCMRIGLVRKDFATELFLLKADEIKEFLKINPDLNKNKWYPLRLSKNLDRRWYNSFMKCHEATENRSQPGEV